MYAELHCHSNYSFQEGASSVEDLLVTARDLGYRALALTDHDNLCGAMHFAQVAKTLDIQAITGAELTIKDGPDGENGKDGSRLTSHLTFLAENLEGYSQLSNLISYSYISSDRRSPALDLKYLPERVHGLILLTGCRTGRVPSLLAEGRYAEAETQLRQYLDWFGTDNVFVELQQNLVQGDTRRNRRLIDLARKLGVGTVATNNVHYHVPDRHRLQDALVSIKHNRSLEETHKERRANNQFYLKSPVEMAALFARCPEAIKNTVRIAERCSFDLTKDLAYRFPDYPVPEGATAQSHLEDLCRQAAQR
ncbi:MAG: PHP domain-containing protein, partial [Dehalococcoidia bacterium]